MNTITRACLLPCIAVGLTACGGGAQSETPVRLDADQQMVVEAVDDLFAAMLERDTSAIRQLLIPDARFMAVSGNGFEQSDADYFVGFLGAASEDFLERMWEPEVRIEGPIATVWTSYDFHRNGAFSHCGVDAFQLVRSENQWRIASIIYTVQREQCAESPLGPPS